jgi:hypothetical protein
VARVGGPYIWDPPEPVESLNYNLSICKACRTLLASGRLIDHRSGLCPSHSFPLRSQSPMHNGVHCNVVSRSHILSHRNRVIHANGRTRSHRLRALGRGGLHHTRLNR